MKSVYSKIIAIAFTAVFAVNSQAAIILNGTDSLGVFSLTESFEDFYDHGGDAPNSSNTGFEQVNTAVMMIIEFSGEYALVGTFGGLASIGDLDGASLSMDLINLGTGSFTLIDDVTDPVTVSGALTTIDFSYANKRNDGFIFSLGNGTDVDILVSFYDYIGLDDFIFLSSGESDISVGDTFFLSNTLAPTSVAVSEPTLLFMLISSLFILLRRIKK